MKDAEEDFIEGEAVSLGFFAGVVGNPYSVMAHRINNVLDFHGLPFERRSGRAA